MTSKLKHTFWQLLTQLKVLRHHKLPAWFKYAQIQYNILFRAHSHSEPVTRNILLLTWEFPPQVTGGVYRPISWVKYATDSNWTMTVLCSQPLTPATNAGRYLESTLPTEALIHRIIPITQGPHPRPLPNIDGGLINTFSVYDAGQALIKSHNPSILIASGPPFHNFLAATWLAKQFGCQLVLDYRDEWTKTPFNFVNKDAQNIILEKQCLKRADSVIFTTESQLINAIESFPELDKSKCIVIHNGWEPNDFAMNKMTTLGQSAALTSNPVIKIAYLGNLGPMANPQDFFTILSSILDQSPQLRSRIKLQFIGKKNPAAAAQLANFKYQDTLESVDQVTKQEACQVMQSVDLLLILNPPSIHRYIQGKLYEYIASGTPVLVFGQGGEMAEIISSLDAGIVVDAKTDTELAHALNHFKPQTQTKKSAKIEHWLQTRQRYQLAINMFKHLDSLMQPIPKN